MAITNNADKFATGANPTNQQSHYAEAISINFDELLIERLDHFVTLGPVQSASQLLPLLPEGCYRQFVLIELMKMDMAMMADKGEQRLIDFYLVALRDELPKDCVPLDLVMEEIQLRKQLGEVPTQSEYALRFPQFDGMLGHLHHTSEVTTARQSIKPPPAFAANTQVDEFSAGSRTWQRRVRHRLPRQATIDAAIGSAQSLARERR